MARKLSAKVVIVGAAGARIPAQQYPPGYVDPAPVLAAASAAIGEHNLR